MNQEIKAQGINITTSLHQKVSFLSRGGKKNNLTLKLKSLIFASFILWYKASRLAELDNMSMLCVA